MAKILVVDDDSSITDQIKLYLIHEKHLVEVCDNGLDGIEVFEAYPFDLLILDVVMPGLSGFEVCRRYRSKGGKKPVLMLTGESDLKDKMEGYTAGADDYLTKPFHLKELALKVTALLRRPPDIQRAVLEHGNLALHPSKLMVFKDGRGITLTRNEYHLLDWLMRNPNIVFSADVLLDRVWSGDSDSGRDAVKSTIKRLRQKIDPDGNHLKTERSTGYYFSPE